MRHAAQPVAPERVQVVAELVEAVGSVGKMEAGEDGVVDLLGRPAADMTAALLIQVPFVATARRSLTDAVGEYPPEFEAPLPDRLVRYRDAAGGQHLLDQAGSTGTENTATPRS